MMRRIESSSDPSICDEESLVAAPSGVMLSGRQRHAGTNTWGQRHAGACTWRKRHAGPSTWGQRHAGASTRRKRHAWTSISSDRRCDSKNQSGNFEQIRTHERRLLADCYFSTQRKTSRKAARNLQQKYCDQKIFAVDRRSAVFSGNQILRNPFIAGANG